MRLPFLILTLSCAFALLADPAAAATSVTDPGDGTLVVTAAAGVENDVTIGPGAAPGTIRIADTADSVTPAGACTAAPANAVDCPSPTSVALALGDRDDDVSSAVPVTVDAGTGNDTIDVANGAADIVMCGDGNDDASHADPADALNADCEETPANAGPPNTSILTDTPPHSKLPVATFALSATERATFECQFDGAAYQACDASTTSPTLLDGPHTFSVRATDLVGHTEPTPATFAWSIDTVAPAVTITTAPPAATNHTTVDFGFIVGDPLATIECRLDGVPYGTCDSATAMHYGALAAGAHTFSVRATDAAGNATTASSAWTVDLTPPTAAFTAAPAALTNDPTPAFALTVSDPAAHLECSLDGAAFAACSATPVLPTLADGTHTLRVRATDAAGNATTIASTWTQDATRPQTTLTGGPATSIPVNSSTATLTFGTQGGTRFECSVDGRAFAACASPVTYGGLANGAHTFAVRAVDAAGNADGTPATRSWTVRLDGSPVARIAVARDVDGFTLSGAASTDPNGGALTYRWLRNGQPAGSGATLHYTAPDHETRDVLTLTVVDPGGQRGQAIVALRTRATAQSAAQQALDVVPFASGTRLASAAKPRLAGLRAAIAAGNAQVRVDGYARPGGDAARVAKARATAVRTLLLKGAPASTRVTIAGHGASGAVASNATAAGRARNDRVVVTVGFTGPAARLVTEQEGNASVSRSNAPQSATAAGARGLKLFAFWSNTPGALTRLEEVGSRVDVLAPNWYTLSPADGSVRGGRPNAKVTALSKRLGFAVWPVVNATMKGAPLIDTAAGRAAVVERIGALAARYRLAGVTLDMEEMLPRQQASYSTLVAGLAAALHGKHRKLAIYAVRRTATDVDDGAAAYDWPALARSADLVLASGYNEHSATTTPGPVTTQAGFGALARYAASVSRTKIAPAMGAFGYQWSGSGARMVSSADAERRWPVSAEVGSADGRSATHGSAWFESADDLWARERAASQAGSRWIGLFSLGREPERFWERSAAR